MTLSSETLTYIFALSTIILLYTTVKAHLDMRSLNSRNDINQVRRDAWEAIDSLSREVDRLGETCKDKKDCILKDAKCCKTETVPA